MIQRRPSIMDQLRYDFRSGSVLMKLIIANLAVFVLMIIWAIVGKLMKMDELFIQGTPTAAWWLATSSKPEVLLLKPWSIFTYMFLHIGFLHILMNMIVLYFSGKIFEQMLGAKRLFSTYIIGGTVAAIVHILATNGFPLLRDAIPPGGDVMLGASGSVMAVFVAAATFAPNLKVFLFGIFPVQLKWIALIYVGIDFMSITAQDGVAHFAHLGGAAWGFVMALQLRKGKYIARWFDNLVDNIVTLFKPGKRRMKVKYRRKKPFSSSSEPEYHHMTDEEYHAQKKRQQEEIDRILDKISKSGYDSLNKKEKEILFRASNDR